MITTMRLKGGTVMERGYNGAWNSGESIFSERSSNPLCVIVQKSGHYCLYLDHYRGGTLSLGLPKRQERQQEAYSPVCECAAAL